MMENSAGSDRFLEAAVLEGLMSELDANRLKTAVAKSLQPLDIVASELGIADEKEITSHYAKILKLEIDATPEFLPDLGEQVSVDRSVLYSKEFLFNELSEEHIGLTVCNPFDQPLFDALAFELNREVRLKLSYRQEIKNALEDYRALATHSGAKSDLDNNLQSGLSELDLERLNAIANDAPTVKRVNGIFRNAVKSGASDIHLEPGKNEFALRFRIDGQLLDRQTLSLNHHAGVISRIKILAGLNIAEQRLPQDGQTQVVIEGKEIDFRVSVLPTVHGEATVIRLLNRTNIALSFDALGYSETDQKQISKLFNHKIGMVLLTGPTNSGKSTTLYTALTQLVILLDSRAASVAELEF